MKESEKKKKGKGNFLTYWKIPKSKMWLEQSRFKVTFMQKISRMTTSLTVETETRN